MRAHCELTYLSCRHNNAESTATMLERGSKPWTMRMSAPLHDSWLVLVCTGGLGLPSALKEHAC